MSKTKEEEIAPNGNSCTPGDYIFIVKNCLQYNSLARLSLENLVLTNIFLTDTDRTSFI